MFNTNSREGCESKWDALTTLEDFRTNYLRFPSEVLVLLNILLFCAPNPIWSPRPSSQWTLFPIVNCLIDSWLLLEAALAPLPCPTELRFTASQTVSLNSEAIWPQDPGLFIQRTSPPDYTPDEVIPNLRCPLVNKTNMYPHIKPPSSLNTPQNVNTLCHRKSNSVYHPFRTRHSFIVS